MASQRQRGYGVAVLLGWAVAGILLGGCKDSRYDREPPPGLGTLYVENYTGSRVEVFIDGAQAESVGRGKRRYYDLMPGVHRLAFNNPDIPRAWVGDIDVLEGRRTVVEVRTAFDAQYVYDIRFFFD